MGKWRQLRKQCVSVFGWLERGSTAGEFSNFQSAGRNVYKEVAIMWKNKGSYVDWGGVFGLSIMKHVTLQKIVTHDFRYDPRNSLRRVFIWLPNCLTSPVHLTTPRRHPSLLCRFWSVSAIKRFLQCWGQVKITCRQVWNIWWMTCASAMQEQSLLSGRPQYVVGSKSFRPDQLFKVTEIKQLCCFST